MSDRLQVSFEQLPVALLQGDPSPLAINLASLEIEIIEEQRDGGPNFQVITDNLECSQESNPVLMQLGRIQTKMIKNGHLEI